MRKFYVSVLAVLACLASFAQSSKTYTSFVTNGTWTTAAHWTQNGTSASNNTPNHNDVIIIQTGHTMTVNALSLNDLKLRVYGTLYITGAMLLGSTGWEVEIFSTGIITTGNGGTLTGGTTNLLPTNSVAKGYVLTNSTTPILSHSPLPVKFAGFSVARQNSDVLVQWSTAEEVNALSFEVERSTDGNNWNRIANVAAKGNSSSLTNYIYSDKNVTAAVAYYRIRQVDIDGKYIYTSIQSVKSTAAATDVKVAAISSRLVVQFPSQVKGAVEVRVVSLAGQVISKQVLQQPVGQVILNTPNVKGAYIISVSNAQEINVAKQVVL